MSGEGSFGLSTTEKFFGLIIMVVGVITLYFTLTSMDILLSFTGFFAFLSVVLVILGLVLMTAKPE
jgi:succinate-acetate transporter protein